jgi:hypothetical protein
MVLKEILGHDHNEDVQITMIYATLSKEALHRDKTLWHFKKGGQWVLLYCKGVGVPLTQLKVIYQA